MHAHLLSFTVAQLGIRGYPLNPLTPKIAKNQKLIPKKKRYHAKVLPKRFHLNGHTIGFR